ncbi:BrnA antitoxin family protein [Treponema parvum]|uniref:BrnA antitoxin family protein n=1 Tax=Treponema parvum TaxID=138851 RepID=A0A975F232_9SPIR|nr:BrnA antitoxin family protein [Treponema parvum]QTQ17410.1 BrnA antitoxin family protein [Treponema parvum]
MKTMTLEEVKSLPPLEEERLNEIENFQNTDFSDCRKLTDLQLKNLKPARMLHPEWFNEKSNTVQVGIDRDIIEALHVESQEYQLRINAILRKVVFG